MFISLKIKYLVFVLCLQNIGQKGFANHCILFLFVLYRATAFLEMGLYHQKMPQWNTSMQLIDRNNSNIINNIIIIILTSLFSLFGKINF